MDNKIKKAAEKITMPEDMKERIIKACEDSAGKNIIRNDNDGYADEVSGTERIEPKKHILRTVSAIAACAVLLSGLGATGLLLHRHNNERLTDSDVEDEKTSPFGDFSTFKYRFDAYDGKGGHYSEITYSKLSDFLNNFDWGERVDESKVKGNDKYIDIKCDDDDYDYRKKLEAMEVDGQVYHISWSTSEGYSGLHIVEGGYVSYTDFSSYIATDGVDIVIDSGYYKIDFDAFDGGVQAIIGLDDTVEESTASEDPTEEVTEAVTEDVTIDASELFNEFLAAELYIDTPYVEIGMDQRESIRNFLSSYEWNEAEDYDHIAHGVTAGFERPVLTRLAMGDKNCAMFICEDDTAELRIEKNGRIKRAIYSCDSNDIIAGIAEIIRGGNGIPPSPFGVLNDYKVLNGYDGEYMEFSNMQYISAQLSFDSYEWVEKDDESYIPDGSTFVPVTFITPDKDRYIYVTEYKGMVFVDKTSPDTKVYVADSLVNTLCDIREITKPYGSDWTIDVSIQDNMLEDLNKGENGAKVDEFIINDLKDMLVHMDITEDVSSEEYAVPKYYIYSTYRDSAGNEMGYISYTINTDGIVNVYYYNVCFDGQSWPEGLDVFKIDLDKFEAAINS